MTQIKYWNGEAAITRVFFAPGILSPEAISKMLSNFEVKVFERAENLSINAFVRKVVKNRDYYAVLAIECDSMQTAQAFSNKIEKSQKVLAQKLRTSVYQAINAI